MSYDAWPSPESSRGPLPRIEDLPIADQGYDQEAVREAFDSFYRHAAQLDASLKALESVEVFRREAGELRADLRSLRSLGFGGEPSWASPSYQLERPRREIPSAVPRIAAEATLVITVAVIAGVAGFRPVVIVALMAAAWAIVVLVEWLAARSRVRVAEPLPAAYPELDGEPAPYVEIPATDTGVGWSAFEPAEPEHQPEELTMIGEASSEELVLEENAAEPAAEVEDAGSAEPQYTPETPQPTPAEGRRGWFGRKRATETAASDGAAPSEADEHEPEATVEPSEPPSHVRALAGEDPWERGFDGEDAAVREPEAPAEPSEASAAQGRARRR